MSPALLYLPLATAAGAAALGALVLAPAPRRPLNRAFAAGMAGFAIQEFCRFGAMNGGGGVAAAEWATWMIGAGLLLPWPWILFAHRLGNAARAPLIGRAAQWVIVTGAIAIVVAASRRDGVLVAATAGAVAPLTIAGLGKGACAAAIAAAVVPLVQLETALRNSSARDLWRIKFLVIGLFGALSAQIFGLSQTLLYAAPQLERAAPESAQLLLAIGFLAAGQLRYRLLLTDLYIPRHTAYRGVTLTLAGVYLLALAASAELVRRIGGPLGDFAAWTLAFAALLAFAVLALSDRARERLRLFVDRHLYQDRYDYRHQWIEFTRQLGTAIRLDELLPRLAGFIRDATQARRAVVLLVREHERLLTVAAQTASHAQSVRIPLDEWQAAPAVIDCESAPPLIADALRELGLVLAARMDGPRGPIGAIGVGPPVGTASFGEEDRILLATLAAQAAATCATARLSERLAASEQMEAMSRVAAFVMHDLKNCAATLTMVAANAREHFGNPDFQRDALEAISSTAERIRRLIGKMKALPSGNDVDLAPLDLTRAAEDVVEEMRRALPAQIALHFDARQAAPVYADGIEIRKVLVNLLLNAAEATPREGGAVHVATFADGGDACVEVRDSGPGIPSARLDAGLFAPFKSTKPGGLGVGLYHCKAIVDAHAGRLDVRSEPGRGATFTVRLPVAAERTSGTPSSTNPETRPWQTVQS